jgi:hypothetical protein
MNSKYIVVIAIAIIIIPVCSAEQIINGGFETGDTTGWVSSISDEGYGSITIVDTEAAYGTYSAEFMISADELSSENTASLSQFLEADGDGGNSPIGCVYKITDTSEYSYGMTLDDADGGEGQPGYFISFDTNEEWYYTELFSYWMDGVCSYDIFAYSYWSEFDPPEGSSITFYVDNVSYVEDDEIVNPGFEDMYLWGWVITDNNGVIERTAEEKHSGDYSLKIHQEPGAGEFASVGLEQYFFSQDFIREYTELRFWYYVPEFDYTSYFVVEFIAGCGGGELGGDTVEFYIESETDGWQQGSIDLTELDEWSCWGPCCNGMGRIVIDQSNMGGDQTGVTAYFDDFELYTPTCPENPDEYSIVNGNFETGDTTGWDIYEFGGDIIVDSEYALEGDYGLVIISTVEGEEYINSGITQLVNLTCAKYLYFDLFTFGDFQPGCLEFDVLALDFDLEAMHTLYVSPIVSDGSLKTQHVYINLTPMRLFGEKHLFFILSGVEGVDPQYQRGQVYIDNITLMYDRPEHQYINSNWEQLYPTTGRYDYEPLYWYALSSEHCMHDGYMYSIHVYDPEFSDTYAVTRSLDGYTWEMVTEDIVGEEFGTAALQYTGKIVSHNGDLYAMCHYGDGISYLFKSEDDGYTWEPIDCTPECMPVDHHSFSLVSFGDYIYMTPPVSYGECPEQFIYRTKDGTSWDLVTEELSDNCYAPSRGFIFDEELYVFVECASERSFYSTQDGEVWQYRGGIDYSEEWSSDYVEIFANDTTVFYVTSEGRIFTNTDHCETGSWVESKTLFDELEEPGIGPETYGGGRENTPWYDGYPMAAMYNGNALFVGAGARLVTYGEEDWWLSGLYDMWASYEGEESPTPTPSCAPLTGPITGDTTSYESITFTGSCGECSSDYTYRFEFSGTPDGFTMATETLAIPAPSANETIEIYSPYFPYRTGETYYYRIVRDDGEVGATMTFAAGEVYPVATTTYTEEHYKPFVRAKWNLTELAGIVPVPYFARFGYLLWAIFWGAILMAFWVRQEDVTIPAFIYLIVFTVLNLADWLPSSFVAVSWVFAGICLGAILYTLFRGRKHG